MESRLVLVCLLIVPFHAVLGSSLGVVRSPRQLTGKENSTSYVAVKPEFIAEPDDKFALPNSPAALICEAKFVSRLKFNCSERLVPREILYSEDKDNVTLLIAEISQVQIKNRDSVVLCICVATGYNGQVIKSGIAAIQKAYLDEDFVISPSVDTRVHKNSLVTLRCQPPAGNPTPAVSWWKDGSPVDMQNNRRVMLKSHANLSLVIIRKAKLADDGDYSCFASNIAGRRESAIVNLNVYVDGGWTGWSDFKPCNATKCGNGTKMLKRHCSNPAPENGGQFCTGRRTKREPCRDICPDLEIICPNHTKVYGNRSDVTFQNVPWNQPLVHNRKNGTKYSVEVFPKWAVPPLTLPVPAKSAVHVIKYVVTHASGQTASCSFNLTIFNYTKYRACSSSDCNPFTKASTPSGGSIIDVGEGNSVPVWVCVSILTMFLVLLLAGIIYRIRRYKPTHACAATKQYEGKEDLFDLELPVVTQSSYIELAGESARLKAIYPVNSELEFPETFKEPSLFNKMDIEVEITDGQKREKRNDYKRTNSSISNKSTVSEVSRMMWNMSNIPENADPKMVAWGLVDHNGGKFTIGNTGVSLTIPPEAIPEGRTEGIYVAIMNQEKEHPQLASKESLLSPVVKCGPTGLKFQRPVILSMPHCALLEEGAWNLKVQYNESEPSTASDWKQLIDVNKQDGTEQSHVVVESNIVHLMVDHFTLFALTGESAPKKRAPKIVQVLAYVTPPEVDGDCVVRVYCVGGTPAAVEDVYNQEIKKYRGETIDPPQQLVFKDGGADLSVNLKDLRKGWTSGSTTKRIRFRDIWEGIERMPCCTFVFSLSDTSVSHFRAEFEVRQDCEGGEHEEVTCNVVTSVKQENPGLSKENTNQSNSNLVGSHEASAHLPKVASAPCMVDPSTALLNAGSIVVNPWQYSQADVPGACAAGPAASPGPLPQMSSGYFSAGFESLPTANSLNRELRSKLSVILDPPHEADWKVLAENIGLGNKDIRWIDSRKAFSPTEILFNFWESRDSLRSRYPLPTIVEKLKNMGRDDAAELMEAQLLTRRETSV